MQKKIQKAAAFDCNRLPALGFKSQATHARRPVDELAASISSRELASLPSHLCLSLDCHQHCARSSTAAMILLEPENRLISDLLTKHFAKPTSGDQTLTDFDGVRYHVESSKSGPLTLSMSINCWRELEATGVSGILSREYGNYIRSDTSSGYNVTLEFTPETIPQDEGE
jgi:hypothetical protein